MPISLASSGGLISVNGGIETPDELTARILRITDEDEREVATGLIAVRHDTNIATPYWPFRTTIDEPGIYRLVLDDGSPEGAAFQVFSPDEVPVPGVGQLLPAFDTPTFDDPHGVEPICTRRPQACALHDITLRDALVVGKPIVYLVGTPAHCSTGTCTPALDALLTAHDRLADRYTFLHAEVYADPNATRVAPAVSALGMTYEPALFVTDAQGRILERLDAVFDERELSSVIN